MASSRPTRTRDEGTGRALGRAWRMTGNTLFLRLEGTLQSWGDQQSKFQVRHTAEAPTKSGVLGLLCASLGVDRKAAAEAWLGKLVPLRMGARVDRHGVRCWDYHTVGAGIPKPRADGEATEDALLSRREYLSDASFLVALQGEPSLIAQLGAALQHPRWTLYLGRRCCVPSRPLLEHPVADHPDLLAALTSVPWRPRLGTDAPPVAVDCLLDWQPTAQQPEAPGDAMIWYDVPLAFDPPSHRPRFVVRSTLGVGADGPIRVAAEPFQSPTRRPQRPRADYTNAVYRRRRQERLELDHGLCVFCKSPAGTVQHVTYRRAGGEEMLEDLRALCRLCHDAVTMVEYGEGMTLDRIDPEDARFRERVLKKREQIIQFRSLEIRRRRLSAEAEG